MLGWLELGIRTISKKRKQKNGGTKAVAIEQTQESFDLHPTSTAKEEPKTQKDLQIMSSLIKAKLKEELLGEFEARLMEKIVGQFHNQMHEATQDPCQE